jgi:hypothetical protein
MMADITTCIKGLQTSSPSYSALPEKLKYPISEITSTERRLRTKDFESLPSDLASFICVDEDDGKDLYYMSTAHQPALVEYFAPQNDPIAFSDYTKHFSAYPSLAKFINSRKLADDSVEKITTMICDTHDATEWSRPIGPFGVEEIALIEDALDATDLIRIVSNPFNSGASGDRAMITFSNRLDETHFDTIISRFEIFNSLAAPVKMRIRLGKIVSMLEQAKQASMRGISQPSPIDKGDEFFDYYSEPATAKGSYSHMLDQNIGRAAELGYFEDDNYTPFNVRLFPEDVALIRMHLKDIDNELFVERISSEMTKSGSAPRLYSVDFFADFEKVDELLANVASTNTRLSHSGRSRIAELRREVGRLKSQRDKWTETWVWYPSYGAISGTFVALAFTFAGRWFGGHRGPPPGMGGGSGESSESKSTTSLPKVDPNAVAQAVKVTSILAAAGYLMLNILDKVAGVATGTFMIVPGIGMPGSCEQGYDAGFDGGCYPSSI